jgi:hypothetical protein
LARNRNEWMAKQKAPNARRAIVEGWGVATQQ